MRFLSIYVRLTLTEMQKGEIALNYENSISFEIENAEITLFYEPTAFIKKPEEQDNTKSLCHQHPLHEMFIVLDGTMQLIDENDIITLNTHDVCIVPPKFYHTTVVRQGDAVHRVSLFFIYKKINNEQSNFDFYEIINRLSAPNAAPLVFNISSTYLRILLDVLSNAQNELGQTDVLKIKSILSLIFVSLLENYERGEQINEEPYKRSVNFYKRIIILNELLNLRSAGYELSMNEISELLSLSSRHLNNIFSEEYGTSIKNACYVMRMKQAAFLLTCYPEMSVGQIADRLGYSSSEIFSIMFRRYFKISASEYRKLYRRDKERK